MFRNNMYAHFLNDFFDTSHSFVVRYVSIHSNQGLWRKTFFEGLRKNPIAECG